jgi:hypothetical protein
LLGNEDSSVREFTSVTGEKAPFWSSFFYVSCGDGTVTGEPVLIHQSDSGKMPSTFTMYLNPDWFVTASKSGYQTKTTYKNVARSFVDGIARKRQTGVPHYLFVDGHDSHWDADVLQFLLDNNVYVFFCSPRTPSTTSQMTWAAIQNCRIVLTNQWPGGDNDGQALLFRSSFSIRLLPRPIQNFSAIESCL